MSKKLKRELLEATQYQATQRQKYDERVPQRDQSQIDRIDTPLWRQGWYSMKTKPGWRRSTKDGDEMIVYDMKLPEDTFAEAIGRALATKYKTPRSFAVEVASQGGELFASLVLRGFDRAARAMPDEDRHQRQVENDPR